MKKIIIVEDDEDIADLVAFHLERQGWEVDICHTGDGGMEAIRAQRPDMVILDIMLPGMDGLTLYRHMKEDAMLDSIPVLFLTARAQLEDRLAGLKLGADDYMAKPFSPKELTLRVRNILNRANAGASQLLIRSGPLVLDKNTMRSTLDGEPLELTPAEFKLLCYLVERPSRVQDRYELQNILLGYADTTQSRALDTHIKRLRQKLGKHASLIVTERGTGYMYQPLKG